MFIESLGIVWQCNKIVLMFFEHHRADPRGLVLQTNWGQAMWCYTRTHPKEGNRAGLCADSMEGAQGSSSEQLWNPHQQLCRVPGGFFGEAIQRWPRNWLVLQLQDFGLGGPRARPGGYSGLRTLCLVGALKSWPCHSIECCVHRNI